ncbi:MAG: 50S ribosomal protein L15 [bacterium]
MRLSDVKRNPGMTPKRRVGRGESSGHGKTSARGSKGQNSRSGGGVAPWFEGGQMPLIRRTPKRKGFKPVNKIEFQPVNIGDLDKHFRSASVTPEALHEKGMIHRLDAPVKVLGDGKLTKALAIKAHAFSKSAFEKITAAGGSVEVITG